MHAWIQSKNKPRVVFVYCVCVCVLERVNVCVCVEFARVFDRCCNNVALYNYSCAFVCVCVCCLFPVAVVVGNGLKMCVWLRS